jgi:hypothetical protein
MIYSLVETLSIVVLGLNFLVIARALNPSTTPTKRVTTGAVLAVIGVVVIAVGVLAMEGISQLGFAPQPKGGTAIAQLGVSVVVVGGTEIFRVLGKAAAMRRGGLITVGIGAILSVIILCLSLFGVLPSLFQKEL